MIRYLIVGNGAAGTEAALNIRAQDESAQITLITESHYLHYYRPKLVHFLAGGENQDTKDLITYDEQFYAEKRIFNILGRKITGIDTERRVVVDSFGAEHPYDRLLIATGSTPVVPPIKGIERPGVFTLRSVTDAQRIRQYSRDRGKVLVIGGGLLGLENAWSLKQLGKEVTVAEGAKWLLPRQLDEEGGRHLQAMLEEKGLAFVIGDTVSSLEGKTENGAVSSVRFASGREIEVGAVLVSVGVRGDLAFVKNSPLKTNRGIIVDDYMQTNVPDIWAAGDVAEHRGVLYGLWTVAREQGKVAGLNIAGIPTKYEGSIPSTLLKITGINVLSVGDIQNPGNNVIDDSDEDAYRRLTLEGNKPKSAMVVGDKSAITRAQRIMQGKADPSTFVPPEDTKNSLTNTAATSSHIDAASTVATKTSKSDRVGAA